jgi:DNA-binding IclR family transcriptional regulator
MATRDDGPWPLGEIARGVAMNSSTVHRLLGLLEEERLVHRDEAGTGYALGVEFLRLAWAAAGTHPVETVAGPLLEQLVEASGETATLGLYDPVRHQTCVVAVVESDAPLRYVAKLHEWRDLHTGASGRAVMAFLTDDERARVIEHSKLAPATANTITSPEALERALETVRRKGYALSVEERRLGGVGLAAPVFGRGRQIVGAVGLSLPTARFAPDDEARLARLVTDCAEQVSAALTGD